MDNEVAVSAQAAADRAQTIGMLTIVILILVALLVADVLLEIKRMYERPPQDRR